jgi:methyl-accepting chemotaxis protein
MEMLAGSKELIQESNNPVKVTHEITAGINEMTVGAEQINTAVNCMNELSGKNRQNIDMVMKEVSQFKVA